MLKFALREMKKHIPFFVLCAAAVLIAGIAAYIGIRLIFTAFWLTKGMTGYDFRDLLKLYGWVLFAGAAVLCFAFLALCFSARPRQCRQYIAILTDMGADSGTVALIYVIQSVTTVIIPVICAIVAGECLVSNCAEWLCGFEVTVRPLNFFNAFCFAATFIIIALLAAYLAANVTLRAKKKGQVRDIKLSAPSNISVSAGLGVVGFIRRRKPFAALAVPLCIFVAFVVICGTLTYVDNFRFGAAFDLCARVQVGDDAAYMQTNALSEGCEDAALWRVYSPYKKTGLFVFMQAQCIVLSDENFAELLSLSGAAEAEGISAIMQNYYYDAADHYKRVVPYEEREAVKTSFGTGFDFTVVGFLDDVPAKYSSGYSDLTTYKLFFRQSEFNYYGEDDYYAFYYSCSDEEQTEELKADLLAISGVKVSDLRDDTDQTLAHMAQILRVCLLFLTPLFVLNFAIYFARGDDERRDEASLLYSAGAEDYQLFIVFATDHIMSALAFIILSAIISPACLGLVFFNIVGYYSAFYLPFASLFIGGAAIILFSVLFALIPALRAKYVHTSPQNYR